MASDNPWNDENNDEFNFNSELEKILRDMLSGQMPDGVNLPFDPQSLGQIFSIFQNAQSGSSDDDSFDWSATRKTAIEVASKTPKPDHTPDINQAFSTATLWVDQATDIGAPADMPKALSRVEWVQHTSDIWVQLTEPVANAISTVLTETFQEQVPEEVKSQLGNISSMLGKVGHSMFAMQLGQIVGKLSSEVISGGDIGIPLITKDGLQGGVLLPENIPAFSDGLSIDETEVILFLAVREAAHARLFRHSKWLSSHVFAIIHEYASGIDIDLEHFHDLSHEIDISEPEAIQELLRSGSLIPPKSPRQEVAHERLETLIALVEGWVDVVTTNATKMLPGSIGIAEMMRRRRATGGPSERAFATLIGLEMRPRKLREAVAMWQTIGDATDIETRDSLWGHPDLLPTKEEIENPQLLLDRLRGVNLDDAAFGSGFEEELAKLLDPSKGSDSYNTDQREGSKEGDEPKEGGDAEENGDTSSSTS